MVLASYRCPAFPQFLQDPVLWTRGEGGIGRGDCSWFDIVIIGGDCQLFSSFVLKEGVDEGSIIVLLWDALIIVYVLVLTPKFQFTI